ncbi:MAG: aspartate aminotransferase family protein [Hyphomicrobiales bacterium]|nr:aspartate aminotransferase family protein [Hyphomicrobiales bacterium]
MSEAPSPPAARHGIDGARLAAFLARERAAYVAARPRSAALAARARAHWLDGVPLHWMTDWGLPFPLFVAEAHGATLVDVDGRAHADFCLGDTGSMFGHAPAPVVAAIEAQAKRGMTAMMPSALVPEVGELLAARFALPWWQITMTASDANRSVIRWARAVTGRPNILIFDGAYHGAVDDAHVRLKDGRPILRPGLLGQVWDLREHTRVVPFNDLAAVEAALTDGSVALVLTEPVMTNIGMVQPEPGFHEGLRALTRRYGALLAIDETHTISSGPGGYTRLAGLEPDFFVLGKPIAGGLPAAVWGFTDAVAEGMRAARAATPGYSGMGTTLTANALAVAAMRATLTEVMTDDAFAHMTGLAGRLAADLEAVLAKHRLPWVVTSIGARVEFMLSPTRPRNGGEAATIGDAEIEGALRLALLQRGVVITPFHNMMLISPTTTAEDVARLVAGLDDALAEIAA